MAYEQLKLSNQLCFRFYTISRLITKSYTPLLERLDLTYPQYLTMLVLWEKDHQPVNTIGHRLGLRTNTMTPLLRRLEENGYIMRMGSNNDHRKIIVSLTEKGVRLQERAKTIPEDLVNKITENGGFNLSELNNMFGSLDTMIDRLRYVTGEANEVE